MLAVWCGEGVPYEEALRWQRLLADARAADAIDDVALVLTHEPVYTAGRHADTVANVLGATGIPVVETDRGGDVTYHGPGQLVCYPIRRLPHRKAVRAHVAALERACAATCCDYGVAATASADLAEGTPTGVWVGAAKIAAIGVRVDDGVTSHGLALNVDPDLSHYAGIVPCGLADRTVTSLVAEGASVTLDQVRRRLVDRLSEALATPMVPARPTDLGLTLQRPHTIEEPS